MSLQVTLLVVFLEAGVLCASEGRNNKRPAVAHTIVSARDAGLGLRLGFFRIEVGGRITLFLDGIPTMPFLELR